MIARMKHCLKKNTKMKRELAYYLTCFSFWLMMPYNPASGQGIINNGAYLVLANGAYVHVDGGASGGFTNQGNGRITVTNTGTIRLEGNWVNNASNIAFTSNNGTVELTGANQTIGGSNTTAFNNLTLLGTGTYGGWRLCLACRRAIGGRTCSRPEWKYPHDH
jgi:hypothetical protein